MALLKPVDFRADLIPESVRWNGERGPVTKFGACLLCGSVSCSPESADPSLGRVASCQTLLRAELSTLGILFVVCGNRPWIVASH